jgi:hypothetical protein
LEKYRRDSILPLDRPKPFTTRHGMEFWSEWLKNKPKKFFRYPIRPLWIVFFFNNFNVNFIIYVIRFYRPYMKSNENLRIKKYLCIVSDSLTLHHVLYFVSILFMQCAFSFLKRHFY